MIDYFISLWLSSPSCSLWRISYVIILRNYFEVEYMCLWRNWKWYFNNEYIWIEWNIVVVCSKYKPQSNNHSRLKDCQSILLFLLKTNYERVILPNTCFIVYLISTERNPICCSTFSVTYRLSEKCIHILNMAAKILVVIDPWHEWIVSDLQ